MYFLDRASPELSSMKKEPPRMKSFLNSMQKVKAGESIVSTL